MSGFLVCFLIPENTLFSAITYMERASHGRTLLGNVILPYVHGACFTWKEFFMKRGFSKVVKEPFESSTSSMSNIKVRFMKVADIPLIAMSLKAQR